MNFKNSIKSLNIIGIKKFKLKSKRYKRWKIIF